MKKMLPVIAIIMFFFTLNASNIVQSEKTTSYKAYNSASCTESVLVDCDGDGTIDYWANVDCKYADAMACQFMHSCNNELTHEADCGGTN